MKPAMEMSGGFLSFTSLVESSEGPKKGMGFGDEHLLNDNVQGI